MNGYIQQLTAALAQAEALSPTITPVLDLTGIQKDAMKIGKIVATPISVGSSFSSASQAAHGVNSNAAAVLAATIKPTETTVRDVTFVQNNTSPKALSSAEIYRQTKNQISVAKGALTNATK
jgi:spore maturation protein SpmB